MVQLAQSALPVNEVGGSQLVQSFQSHGGRISRVIAHLCFLTQLPFVHKYGEGLLSCKGEQIFIMKLFTLISHGPGSHIICRY